MIIADVLKIDMIYICTYLKSIHFQNSVVHDFQLIQGKGTSANSAEVPCFESNEDRAQQCFKN